MSTELIQIEKRNHPLEHTCSSAVPNLFLRSAIFGIKKPSRMVENQLLEAQGGHSMYLTGYELNQADEDVWLALKKRAQYYYSSEPFVIRAKDLIKDLRLSDGKTERDSLKRRLERLAYTFIMVRFKDAKNELDLQIKLISEYAHQNGVYHLKFDDNLDKLFTSYTFLNDNVRCLLRGYLAKWLSGYLRSHQQIYPTHIEKYKNLCRSTSSLKVFKQNFIKALEELKENDPQIEDFYISKSNLVTIIRSKKKEKQSSEIRFEAYLRAINHANDENFEAYFNALNATEKKVIRDREGARILLGLSRKENERLVGEANKKIRAKVFLKRLDDD